MEPRRNPRTEPGSIGVPAPAGTGSGKPGDGDRDSSGTGQPRWKTGRPAPGPSRIAHRKTPVNGSPEPPRCESFEPSVEEGFPHIHSPYYFY